MTLLHFHDAIAWLMQIIMFFSLGLLVFPSQLVPFISVGTLTALFLILIARPLAVFVSLAFFKELSLRKKMFISWVGLRGAIPIILATIPLTSGVPGSGDMFNIVFFIVVASVLIQGTTINVAARLLDVLIEGEFDSPERRAATGTIELVVAPGAKAIGMQVVELGLPRAALIVLLTRGSSSFIARGDTIIKEGDKLLIATRKHDIDELKRIFSSCEIIEKEQIGVLGAF